VWGDSRRARTSPLPLEAAWFLYWRQPDGSWSQHEVRGGRLMQLWRQAAGVRESASKGAGAEPGEPAARATATRGSGITAAPPGQIATVFVVLMGPLVMCWLYMSVLGSLERHYAVLLPVTLVVFLIGFDTTNQSLSALTDTPLPLTAFHALCLWVSMAVWMVAFNWKEVREMDWRPLISWVAVMIFFMCYQMMNHLVSYFCSLSERTIFLNLCPVVSLALELSVMPPSIKPQATWKSKLALLLVAVGAVLFTVEKADFTTTSVWIVSAFVGVLIPYRMVQRWAVTSTVQNMPVSVLAGLDGLALFAPAAIASVPNAGVFLRQSFADPSAAFLAFLSAVCFIGVHLCGILMMRVGSATSYIVFSNMANFILVGVSFAIFNEDIFQSALMVTGLLLSLLSGFWYAWQVSGKEEKAPEEPKPEAGAAGASGLLEAAK